MKKSFLVILACLSGILYSQTSQTLIGPPGIPQNYIVPCGVTSLSVQIYGGGGGGAGDATASNGISGGGGGGGGYSTSVISVVPGQSIPYIVGTGGTMAAAGANGGNGGTTTFNGVSANGGMGGQASGTGGTGGAGNTTNGVDGGNGDTISGAGGASGGGALGGPAIPGDANGLNGASPGGGGSGGNHINGGTNTGGAGGAGLIIVTYMGPDAGTDQYICATSTVMAANAPLGGTTGIWTQIAGPVCTITAPTSPTTTVTGLTIPSVVTLRWTWSAPPVGCSTRYDDVVIYDDTCSGVTNEFVNLHLIIYPNPAKDFINVALPNYSKICNYDIYDLLGKKMQTGLINSSNTMLDVSFLRTGVYVLEVAEENNKVTKQFVKTN